MPPAKDKQLTLGVPLNGILTFRGRTLPGEWQCAVCTTRNPKDEPRCSCCRQLRVVDWLRNTKGMLLQPGVVLVGHEPAGAVAIAGLKKYVDAMPGRAGQSTGNFVAVSSDASNIEFDILRFIAERASIGEQREKIFAMRMPDRTGPHGRRRDPSTRGGGATMRP